MTPTSIIASTLKQAASPPKLNLDKIKKGSYLQVPGASNKKIEDSFSKNDDNLAPSRRTSPVTSTAQKKTDKGRSSGVFKYENRVQETPNWGPNQQQPQQLHAMDSATDFDFVRIYSGSASPASDRQFMLNPQRTSIEYPLKNRKTTASTKKLQ